jgi:hypothetical protein
MLRLVKTDRRSPEEIRSAANAETLHKYRTGHSLTAVSPEATWWPPRPIIKKDAEAFAKLYGEDTDGTVQR